MMSAGRWIPPWWCRDAGAGGAAGAAGAGAGGGAAAAGAAAAGGAAAGGAAAGGDYGWTSVALVEANSSSPWSLVLEVTGVEQPRHRSMRNRRGMSSSWFNFKKYAKYKKTINMIDY